MKGKKILAVIAAAGAVIFGQASISEAYSVTTDKSTFTFATRNFPFDSYDKFNYVAQMAKWRCTECGKIVTTDINQHPNDVGYARPCPNKGSFHGDYHVWHFQGIIDG